MKRGREKENGDMLSQRKGQIPDGCEKASWKMHKEKGVHNVILRGLMPCNSSKKGRQGARKRIKSR